MVNDQEIDESTNTHGIAQISDDNILEDIDEIDKIDK